jgi:LytS/YehU family sensor histidine kinase
VRYKYRMIGGDEQWITTENREISFSGLTPGEYRLEIIAINSDGQESNHPAVFAFNILAPFYRTPWFILLMVFVLIALVWWGANYRLRKKQKLAKEKAETERRIAELRLSALRAQMNPHFIFNAINSIQHFVLQNDSEHAYNYLAKFSRLIRLVLDQSQSESIPLEQELKMLHLYIELEQLRFERPFTYKIEVDPELEEDNIKIPGMLVQPFIENAIWHGLLQKKDGEAKIMISFRKKAGFTEITIEDNGVGREAAAAIKQDKGERRSYGLQITEERLRLGEHKTANQPIISITDMKDANGNALGTKVVIHIASEEDDD